MDLVAVESSNGAKSPYFGVLIGENYKIMLKESIDRFLDECRKGISDFSGFGSIFFRLLQARVDPPLETIWLYSAVSFRNNNLADLELLNRVLRVRDLFQLLSACSASCNSLKSIAVLGPVLFELYQSVVELWEKKLSMKSEKKVMREVECLIEGICSYISICGSGESDGEDVSDGLVPCFVDLIRVWTVNRLEVNHQVREMLTAFFPLVGDEIRDGFGEGRCGVSYLAGVVSVEAFLLRLILKFRSGLSKSELQKELKSWAVGSITGFRNCYFFEILLRLLLEPTLPVTSLLSSEDEALLRKVLYDAVILVEYSFLNPGREIQPTSHCMKNLGVTRLIVVHEAIQIARENGDQTKAISYMNAFSISHLPSELIRWATSQIGMEEKASKLNLTTPQALIKWLLNLEDQGVRLFDSNMSKFRAKLVLDLSKMDYEDPAFKPESKATDGDLFFIDNRGDGLVEKIEDQEMVESMDVAFLAAAHMMKSTINDGQRKRKEGRTGEGETRVKFLKYDIHERSMEDKFLLSGDGDGQGDGDGDDDDDMSSGSEVENPLSDEDTEEMEK